MCSHYSHNHINMEYFQMGGFCHPELLHTGSFWFGGPTSVGEDPKAETLPINEGTPKVLSLIGPKPAPWGSHLPGAGVGPQEPFPPGSSLAVRSEGGAHRVQRSGPGLGSAARLRLCDTYLN